MQVPSLDHNGKVLGESLDLIGHVDAIFEGASLVSIDPAKKESSEQLISHVDIFAKDLFSSLKGDVVQQAVLVQSLMTQIRSSLHAHASPQDSDQGDLSEHQTSSNIKLREREFPFPHFTSLI